MTEFDEAGRVNALARLNSPTGGSIAPLYWRDPRTVRRAPERPAADDWAFAPDARPAGAARRGLVCAALIAFAASLAILAAGAP